MRTCFLSVGHNNGKNWVPKGNKWIKSMIGDKGAVGNGTTEYDVVKKIVDTILMQGIPGIEMIIRVPDGLNLTERVEWINRQIPKYPEPFAFEFHLDASTGNLAKGCSAWYRDKNGYTQNEGQQFLAEYTKITGLTSRHVNSDATNRLGQLGFVRDTKCASLLVELGFISNPTELKTILQKGVDGVKGGIVAMNKS